MRATVTSKGQVTIPKEIRDRLGIETGHVLEFDENAPFLKAIRTFDEGEMRAVLGRTKGRLKKDSKLWLEETRGMVELPKD